jgi:hypothetical protein
MAKKRRAQPRPGEASSTALANALAGLRQAKSRLEESVPATQPPDSASAEEPAPQSAAHPLEDGEKQSAPTPPRRGSQSDSDSQLYYEQLEQAGRLQDVKDEGDLAHLDPRITHVRWPDGTIERLGFAGGPVGEE